ncbi:MAG: flagellar hook protein FlgE [Kofleriaceae bacterium]
MSINSSLYIGTSAITAHGEAISIVGDNIANTSTIGFKRQRAAFADVLGGNLGAQRLGGGVRLGSAQTLYDQGALLQTGNDLDLGIRGNGFFALRGRYDGVDGNFYTRDGRFTLDVDGNVVDLRGLKLQGYLIDGAGVQATTISDLPLGARQSAPVPTTTADLVFNFDATAVPPAAFDPADPVTTSNYATSMTVFDSLGTPHQVQLYARAQGGGAWEWHAMVDGGELAGGTPGVLTEIGQGTLAFTTTGALDVEAPGAFSADFIGATPGQAIAIDFGDAITTDGGTGLNGSTQFSAPSTVNALAIDGRASGNLSSVNVTSDGTIEGVFDNGDARALARIALAEFNAEDGLVRAGSTLLAATTRSGQALLDAAGTGGRGAISGGALEGSNVDLGTELVTLIAYQRAFQANSKIISTADEMLAEVANLKR